MATDNAELVRLWWAGLNEHGLPPLELCDERIEIRMFEGFPIQGPYHGHDGVRRYVRDTYDVIDELRVVLDEVVDAGDGETVVTAQRARGRASHTQLEVDYPWAVVWTVRGGKVVRARGHASKAEALEAAGLTTPGSGRPGSTAG
jgi:ketosteroid isomerase-like protein